MIFSQNWRSLFFWIFFVKTIKLTNFKHYSHILGDFWVLGPFFSIFFYLEHFWKTLCSEIVCAFVWHLNTLKLNSIIKHISNFMKFIKKTQEKKCNFFFEFLTVIDIFGPYNQAPTWILEPPISCNFINLRMIFFQKHLRIGRFKHRFKIFRRFWN